MRMMYWIAGALAVGVSLHSWFYDGLYTGSVVHMLSDMATGFGFHSHAVLAVHRSRST